MKKIIVIVVVFLAVLTPFLIKYSKEKKAEEEQIVKTREDLNYNFAYWLYIEGDFVISLDDIDISNATYNPAYAEVAISYYNYYNDTNLTYQQLMDEYDSFRTKNKGYENLESYAAFMEEQQFKKASYQDDKYIVSYNLFYKACKVYLEETATADDAQSISQKVFDEIEELYTYASIMDINLVLLELSSECGVLQTEYFDEQLSEESKNTAKVWLEDGAVELVLEKNQWIWRGDTEQWLVTGIVITESCQEKIFGITVGGSYDDVKTRVKTAEEYGYILTTDTATKLIFSKDGLIEIGFGFTEDGVCTEISVEIVH